MSYIVSREKNGKKEYLQNFRAKTEEWGNSPIGAKTYPTKQAAKTVCDIVRLGRKESYEVEQI